MEQRLLEVADAALRSYARAAEDPDIARFTAAKTELLDAMQAIERLRCLRFGNRRLGLWYSKVQPGDGDALRPALVVTASR